MLYRTDDDITLTALGSDLSKPDQECVLAAFTQRYTGDHAPVWIMWAQFVGNIPPVQFKDDAEWLAHTRFGATMRGTLDRRSRKCWEAPTWPDDPTLRTAPPAVQAHYGVNLRYPGWEREWKALQKVEVEE